MLFCNLFALTSEERRRQRQLWRKLIPVATKRAVDHGYSFQFAPEKFSLVEAAELIGMESRCCSFAALRLEVEPGGRNATLVCGGPKGTQEILDAQAETIEQP